MQARTLDMDDKEGDGDFGQSLDSTDANDVKLPPSVKEPVNYSLLGARADLRLAPDAASTATCNCLAAVVGSASDTAFQWEETYPKTNPDTQLVIAFSSENVLCADATPESMGGSYWGYEISGNDLVIVIEDQCQYGQEAQYGSGLDDPKARCELEVHQTKVIPDLPHADRVKPMSQEKPLTLTPTESPNE